MRQATSSVVAVKPPRLVGYQHDILYAPQRFTICEASTKSGKTFSHIFWLFRMATISESNYHSIDLPHKRICKPGNEYWWIAPVYGQAEIAFNRMWRKLERVPGFTRNISKMTIATPIGTIIRFKSGEKPDNLFGEDVWAVVIDEGSRCKYFVFEASRSLITATGGPLKIIGNYVGNANWQHQQGLKAKSDPNAYAYFKVTARDAVRAGILTKEEVDQAERDLLPATFKALYMAEGDVDKSRWIKDEAINNLRTNSYVAKEGGRSMYLTADIAGEGSDRFVVGVWKANEKAKELIHLHMMEKSSAPEVEKVIKDLGEEYGVQRSNMCYDADGLGQFLKGYLRGAKEFHNGGSPIKQKRKEPIDFQNLKSQCYYEMAMSMNSGEYYLPEDIVDKHWMDLCQELEVVKNRNYKKDGKTAVLKKEQIDEIIHRSPDFSDMIMMLESFFLKPSYKPIAV